MREYEQVSGPRCADELTPTIFCQRPEGHSGAHSDKANAPWDQHLRVWWDACKCGNKRPHLATDACDQCP